MRNPAMRCIDCSNFLHFAFIDDITGATVYQCRTVGVETERTIGRDTALVRPLDHSDRFYARIDGVLRRVVPVRLGRAASKDVFKANGFPFERGDDGKEIVPVVWTTRLAANRA